MSKCVVNNKMSKYVVNKTNIAYKFQNGMVLGRKGSIEVNEKAEKELDADFFFNSLKDRGAIAISNEKPKDLSEAGKKIAAKEAQIKSLENKIKELEAKLDAAGATGKETNTVIDSSEPTAEQNPDLGSEPTAETGKEKKK